VRSTYSAHELATTTRNMSRKRARRSNITATSIASREDGPATRVVQNSALQLPTELIYNILAIAIGEYMGDMMLLLNRIQQWDAIMTFLHVSRTFRGCTIKLLYHLWGDTFIRERTSIIANYKPTYTIFRQLSRQARSAPHSFISRDEQPKLLSARVVRHPISPLARIWSALIRNTAVANAVLLDAEKDWRRIDFEDVYAAKDLQMIMDSYAEIPAGIRSPLLGRVMHRVMTQAAIWTKLKALRATVSSVFRLLVLLMEAVGQIEICTEVPKITQDSVAQVSRDKHASLADIFSLTVEDIPPMLQKHTAAVGLHMVLFLLDVVESRGNRYTDLCQMMRSYIASYLTDDERGRYLG